MNTTYQAIQKRAKALEKETVRFLADIDPHPILFLEGEEGHCRHQEGNEEGRLRRDPR